MKKYFFIIISILALSCNNSKKSNIENEKVAKRELRPFFDSDEIDHYYLGQRSDFEHSSRDNQKQIEKKKEFATFFYGYYPNNVEKILKVFC